ncbi:MAG TPA: TA system VapC family ribonuclease toxin [Terriglobales bacterium]|jgi:toxin-antitoxin system PIN domain toxin
MTVRLLDVNMLLALAWPGHEFHIAAQTWFAQKGSRAWATCPITQAGFVRISSNPAFSARAVSVPEALKVLEIALKHPRHHFWPDDISFPQATQEFANNMVGPKQATDAYLLGLAERHHGVLATLDSRLPSLLQNTQVASQRIEVISQFS